MSYLSPLKSELKLGVLLSLLEGEKKLSELVKKEKLTRETTLLHALKELEQLELTVKSSGTYKLTPLGVIEAQICKKCYLSVEVLKKHKDFWLNHDISGIPSGFIANLGDLENSEIIRSTVVDLQNVHETFMELLYSSKTIFGVSPIFHPDYIIAFKELLSQGCKIKLIINQTILEKLEKTNEFNKYVSEDSLQIFLNNNLKFALTVTEKNWSLGLFNPSGDYDYANDLVGNEEKGRKWAYELFKEVLEQSTKM